MNRPLVLDRSADWGGRLLILIGSVLVLAFAAMVTLGASALADEWHAYQVCQAHDDCGD